MNSFKSHEEIRRALVEWSLHFAVQEGDLAKVDQLLEGGSPINAFDELGNTPLHYAVEGEFFEIVDRLIKGGADVNAHNEQVAGNTPLGGNAGKCSYKMAKRLIDAGADPKIPGCMQINAIHRAAERVDPQAKKIQTLLRHAAEPRKQKGK